MAYWLRRNGNKVYVYTRKNDKAKQLPRRETSHLDELSERSVEAWVQDWELKNEGHKTRRSNNPTLTSLLDQYLSYQMSRKKYRGTISQYSSLLSRYVFPFFLSHGKQYQDVKLWPAKSVFLLDFLTSKKLALSTSTIKRVNIVLRGFWKWLYEERVVETETLRLRNPVAEANDTPLKFTLEPGEVLAFAERAGDVRIKLLALCGYFFSLRPQELFALDLGHFRAGKDVEELDVTGMMADAGLFNRLAYFVDAQRDAKGGLKAPKSGSRGWVCCFDREAGEAIVGLVNELEGVTYPDNRAAYRLWKRHGIEGISLKDLRRASLYWLGHHTGIQPLQLKRHARHQHIDTTMLYIRSPEAEVKAEGKVRLEL